MDLFCGFVLFIFIIALLAVAVKLDEEKAKNKNKRRKIESLEYELARIKRMNKLLDIEKISGFKHDLEKKTTTVVVFDCDNSYVSWLYSETHKNSGD